jgi:hypothetical protein
MGGRGILGDSDSCLWILLIILILLCCCDDRSC